MRDWAYKYHHASRASCHICCTAASKQYHQDVYQGHLELPMVALRLPLSHCHGPAFHRAICALYWDLHVHDGWCTLS